MTSLTCLREVEKKGLFSQEELDVLQKGKIPKHLAIIMDGNRRWAKKRGLPPMMGHWEGAEVITEIVRAASELGVEMLTVYSFSTENWKRSSEEIEELMKIFAAYLDGKKESMIEDGVELRAIGDIAKLPVAVQEALSRTETATRGGEKIRLNLAMNYGARDEICRAVQKMLQDDPSLVTNLSQITEEKVGNFLDTHGWPDPDLLIRTSGEMRVSNFLLWQISYAEMYVTDVLWPDFSPSHLMEALVEFQQRERRRGGGV